MKNYSSQDVRVTEVYLGRSYRVSRIIDPVDGLLIAKQAREDGDPDALAAIRNEYRILERLRGVETCPIPVRFDPVHGELALKGFEGGRLDRSGFLGKIGLELFLSVSEALAHAVEAVHGRGVIHKDLKPANILIHPVNLGLQIVDFDFATTFAEEFPPFDHMPHLLGGDLAYISPEQTGRMNRPVDYRTDLYSLGAILYALATGTPPFNDSDRLSLIHAHLARSPLPPHERASWLPLRVSELILALLAKEPDDRYQSAAGLAHDLREFSRMLAQGSPIDRVVLKERDIPLSLRPPRRLYGRDGEMATLMAIFDSVSKGSLEGLFIAGYSGVGKTALIHELFQPVTLRNGFFISGKFEQFQRDRPFLAPTQSLRQLCQLLLAEPESSVIEWRQRILSGITTASVLFEVVPELEALLGPQNPAPELGPLETQIRLHKELISLIRQIASPDRPLVLFLDDLHWADVPSLKFLEALLQETDIHGLLLVGAYRDNEVDSAQQLMRILRHPMASGQLPTIMTLANLTPENIILLLIDMLHMPPDSLHPLASAIYTKTGGNAYFSVEFLQALHREGILRPDPEKGIWLWDETAVLMRETTVNVVDFLTSRLAELMPETIEALVAAAYLGAECVLGELAVAMGRTGEDLAKRLAPALEHGTLITSNALAFHQAETNVKLRFCHDRMQQTVSQLYDSIQGPRLHLEMARRFARAGSDAASRFRAAEHYAIAAPLLVETGERAAAQGLFLNAALQARQSGSFAAAEHFLRLGIEQLEKDALQNGDDTAFTLHAELHVVLYSQSRNDDADEVYAMLATHATSPLVLVWPTCIQVMSLSNRTRYDDAVSLASALLGKLGMDIPIEDVPASLERELELFYHYVSSGALDRLNCEQTSSDPRLSGIARLMNRMITAAFLTQPLLSLWLAVRSARQWIENGYQEFLLFPMSSSAMATIVLRNDYVTGIRVAETALASGQAHEGGVETARSQHVWGLFNNHWRYPLETSLTHARAAFDGLLSAAEMEYACYTFFTSQAAMLDTCTHLAEMKLEVETALNFTRKTGNRHGEQSYIAFHQLIRSLEGKTHHSGGFDDDDFEEQAHLHAIRGNSMALCYYHIYRSLAACLFNEYEVMVNYAEAAVPLTPYIAAFYPTVLTNLLHSLALVHQMRVEPETDRPALMERLVSNQTWLAARAADAPMNFLHLYDLVEAERLDVVDCPWEAIRVFERAMHQVRGRQRQWHYALIVERAGLCHMRRGLEHTGRSLLMLAHDLFRNWGAKGKARAMRHELPFIHAHHQDAGRGGSLDYEALLRASQVLASERTLERLVVQFVELVGQLTGATDVRLLIPDEEGHWFLEGGLTDAEVLGRMPLVEAEELGIVARILLPLGLRTLSPVVSDDAVIDTRFRGDPHFSGLLLCSLLALPVLFNGRAISFLILEHRLVRAAFNIAKVETISLLCSQLSTSLENIRVYRSLERKVSERTCDLEEAKRKLENLSLTDGLTGIANRRRMDEMLSVEWRRAFRSRMPLALAMIDVDWFKKYNDRYGHQEGDECLRAVARVLQGQLRRASDLVARYGGEEFVFISPETGIEGILNLAERVRAAIESLALAHADSPYGVVTISIGAASCVPGAEDAPDGLIKLADASLYQAKHGGRNQVFLADNKQ